MEGGGAEADGDGAAVSMLVIATPCYGGTVWQPFTASALETAHELSARKISHGWLWAPGDSLVQRARNNLVAEFLALPRASHLLFIDADIEWKALDVVRLLGHDRDIIGGVYPKKILPTALAMNPLLDDLGRSQRDPKTGAVRVADLATGFMMIKRRVFERMIEAMPHIRYNAFPSDNISDGARSHLAAYFDCSIRDGAYYSEDYEFCRRWQEIGGEVWCDPAIELVHHGAHAYRLAPDSLIRAAT